MPILDEVLGPTAFDEIRCELRAADAAPRLARCALRTTGKLSVALLSKFVHARLELGSRETVVLRCSGEELVDGMTLGQIGAHVWPKAAGHIVLEYAIADDSDDNESVVANGDTAHASATAAAEG